MSEHCKLIGVVNRRPLGESATSTLKYISGKPYIRLSKSKDLWTALSTWCNPTCGCVIGNDGVLSRRDNMGNLQA